MVILGGLEIVAAGYLLNEFNKDRVDERTRRRHKQSSSHDHDHHDDDRPSRPAQTNHDSNSLRPPMQNPPRPLSAPPAHDQGPWQQQQQQPPPFFPQAQQFNQQQPPPNSRPVQQWQPGPGPPPFPQFNNNNNPSPAPNTGALQRPHTFHPSQPGPSPQQQQQFPQRFPSAQQPPAPSPGALQRPNTFHPPGPTPNSSLGPTPGPYLQQAGTFPLQNSQPNLRPTQEQPLTTPHAPVKPGPIGPLQYIDSRTGRVFHNLYPPDHPMSRSNVHAHDDSELPREVYFGDKPYDRQLPGDVHTGLLWTDADENNMAYGKDYSSPRERDRDRDRNRTRRQGSYERNRDRGRSSPPPPYGY